MFSPCLSFLVHRPASVDRRFRMQGSTAGPTLRSLRLHLPFGSMFLHVSQLKKLRGFGCERNTWPHKDGPAQTCLPAGRTGLRPCMASKLPASTQQINVWKQMVFRSIYNRNTDLDRSVSGVQTRSLRRDARKTRRWKCLPPCSRASCLRTPLKSSSP